jgi:hypothetical protein
MEMSRVWPRMYLRTESPGRGRIRPPKLHRSLVFGAGALFWETRLSLGCEIQGLEGRYEELVVVGSMT